ncbi:hypothetical protein [Thermoanaerobacter sp. A7A]|uniref:hypothetical protein n=1 Tax=Thermoanaerobacter sp. A7A TaxID=1350366 RepID=UPI0004002153|nr:hypothetical protein [Thermoanaerobacter sp. A7A]
MKKALVILIILTLLFGGCQTKREVKESNIFHKLFPNFQYFQMIDKNNGWAIGENMGENRVFITIDGGSTWITTSDRTRQGGRFLLSAGGSVPIADAVGSTAERNVKRA